VDAFEGLPGPGTVINTGGWVVDAIEPEEHKGASVILIDADLDIAIVRCFGQGAVPGTRVMVEGPPDDPDNALVKQVSDRISAAEGVWRTLAEATTATEKHRRDQLRAPAGGADRRAGPSAGHRGRRPHRHDDRGLTVHRLARPHEELGAHYESSWSARVTAGASPPAAWLELVGRWPCSSGVESSIPVNTRTPWPRRPAMSGAAPVGTGSDPRGPVLVPPGNGDDSALGLAVSAARR